jgi:uncharacterized protein
MIVDCHTHIWQSAQQVGLRSGVRPSRPAHPFRSPDRLGSSTQASVEQHLAACKPVDAAFVLGLRSRHLDLEISNDFLAEYIRRYPERMIGFAGIDPLEGGRAQDELQRARQELGLRGVVIAPACQAMHPAHSLAMAIYERAEQLGMPVVFHNSPRLSPGAYLEFARPYLLDEVARSFPGLRILIAQMGHPWMDETLVLLAKHEHVYADISGLTQSPWQALHCMQSAYERGVMDKMFFGSDFPASDPKSAIEALYSLNLLVHGTNLPSVPREQIRGVVERNSPALLGIDVAIKAADAATESDASTSPGKSDAMIHSEPEQSA